MSTSAASPDLHPMAAPPVTGSVRVLIPSSSSQQDLPMVTPNDSASSLTGNATGGVSGTGKEKVGRWTEQEHMAFLEGLEKHGKQWKTIAGMIGTRTVVQVRTHAQKYFQKIERKSQAQGGSSGSVGVDVKPTSQLKRKSLPGTLPSNTRKKAKKVQRLSLSLDSFAQADTLQDFEIPTSPSPVPTQFVEYRTINNDPAIPLSKSVSSTGSENWSTVSPNNVAVELIEFDPYSVPNPVPMDPIAEHSVTYDLQDLGEDPLEWLVDIDTQQYLPESSLPAFPDLGETCRAAESHHSMGPVPDPIAPTLQADMNMVEDAVLNMVDPHVTMQSLFLPNEQFLDE